MNQQRLIFEYPAGWLLACIVAGVGYAWLLYSAKSPWTKSTNRMLMGVRAVLVTLLAFLLLGPLLKLIRNDFEKPVWVLLVDDSQSVRQGTDSVARNLLRESAADFRTQLAAADYEAELRTLSGTDSLTFSHQQSDLAGPFRKIQNDFEGRNLAGVVLVSDGVYNSGSSPLYLDYRVPVFSVGVGDTTVRPDLAIRNVGYNKVVYQGNRFPLRVEVLASGIANAAPQVRVRKGGQLIASQTKTSTGAPLSVFDFEIEARDKGVQRFDVEVVPLPDEKNVQNNRYTVFLEVADGKKRIVLIAPAPHPDIKALEAVIQSQSNYEWIVHIPNVKPTPANWQNGQIDLLILHQALNPKMIPFLQQAKSASGGVWLITGYETNPRMFAAHGLPFVFENSVQRDEVTPVLNSTFRDFAFGENTGSLIARYPPVSVPFGKFSFPPDAHILLHQRIGSVATARPLLLTWNENEAKRALLLADGLWRWRLSEFRETEKTEAFAELTGKLVQYLSTREDRSRFRCFSVRPEFSGAEPVQFESQLYNELLEPIYGNAVQLEITDENNRTERYTYATSPGNMRYRLGQLPQGVYRYRATTVWNNITETTRGEFVVNAQSPESQQTTADFRLLQQLSEKTGGQFFALQNFGGVARTIANTPAKRIIRTDETFQSLLQLKWVFFVLLVLVSVEWFARKFLGGY